MVIAKLSFSMTCPTNKELFQITRIPPEAPMEGIKSNLSNLFGVNFLMNCESKNSLFVSWRQIIEAALSSILFLRVSHLLSPFIPLIFQHKIFQLLFIEKKRGLSRPP
jgi:hypothetical protein